MLDEDGATYPSLRREPSLTRAIGDAFLGSKIRRGPASCPRSILGLKVISKRTMWTGRPEPRCLFAPRSHASWGTGTRSSSCTRRRPTTSAGFVRAAAGPIRAVGRGKTPQGRVRDVAGASDPDGREPCPLCGTTSRAAFTRCCSVRWSRLREALRSYDAVHRRTLAFILNRRRWQELPQATKPPATQQLYGENPATRRRDHSGVQRSSGDQTYPRPVESGGS